MPLLCIILMKVSPDNVLCTHAVIHLYISCVWTGFESGSSHLLFLPHPSLGLPHLSFFLLPFITNEGWDVAIQFNVDVDIKFLQISTQLVQRKHN